MQNYQVKIETIQIDSSDYQIRSLKDRQQFYDHEGQAEKSGISSATWSLFGVVWPASRVLATTVSLLELEGKRILEVGCGLALASIVLHKMGLDITASDYHPLAREFLDNNIKRNHLSPIKFQAGNWETANPSLSKFDLIIGSDVLYEPAHARQVSRFIHRHSGPDVDVIIVDPNRGNRSRFTKMMIKQGYSHHFEPFHIHEPEANRCKGRILHFHR